MLDKRGPRREPRYPHGPWVYVAAWPVLDPDRSWSLLLADARTALADLTAEHSILLLEEPTYELRDDVKLDRDVPRGTLLLVARAPAVPVSEWRAHVIKDVALVATGEAA